MMRISGQRDAHKDFQSRNVKRTFFLDEELSDFFFNLTDTVRCAVIW